MPETQADLKYAAVNHLVQKHNLMGKESDVQNAFAHAETRGGKSGGELWGNLPNSAKRSFLNVFSSKDMAVSFLDEVLGIISNGYNIPRQTTPIVAIESHPGIKFGSDYDGEDRGDVTQERGADIGIKWGDGSRRREDGRPGGVLNTEPVSQEPPVEPRQEPVPVVPETASETLSILELTMDNFANNTMNAIRSLLQNEQNPSGESLKHLHALINDLKKELGEVQERLSKDYVGHLLSKVEVVRDELLGFMRSDSELLEESGAYRKLHDSVLVPLNGLLTSLDVMSQPPVRDVSGMIKLG